jgi:hypothetical protein
MMHLNPSWSPSWLSLVTGHWLPALQLPLSSPSSSSPTPTPTPTHTVPVTLGTVRYGTIRCPYYVCIYRIILLVPFVPPNPPHPYLVNHKSIPGQPCACPCALSALPCPALPPTNYHQLPCPPCVHCRFCISNPVYPPIAMAVVIALFHSLCFTLSTPPFNPTVSTPLSSPSASSRHFQPEYSTNSVHFSNHNLAVCRHPSWPR